MTSIAHPTVEQVRRATLRDIVRKWMAAVTTVARVSRSRIAAIAMTGQLGPGLEVEDGRRTGARV